MITKRNLQTTLSLVGVLAGAVAARADELYLRVVDAGPALCTVVQIPGGHYFVYDTGWRGTSGNRYDGYCFEGIEEVVGNDSIDLMVLSHRDADHLGATDELLSKYSVDRLVRTAYKNPWHQGGASKAWKEADKAIRDEPGLQELNLYTNTNHQIDPGFSYQLGPATVSFVIGYHKPPASFLEIPDNASTVGNCKKKPESGWQSNAGSIVVRLTYAGKSILFTGDAIGRRVCSRDREECLATESAMVRNAASVPIDSEVLVASHHGGNNGSAKCFIREVSPEWVVFSSGSKHQHPAKATVDRFLAEGVSESRIFRTDRGDYESGPYHWQKGTTGLPDLPRDDDVEVFIHDDWGVCVRYAGSGKCESEADYSG